MDRTQDLGLHLDRLSDIVFTRTEVIDRHSTLPQLDDHTTPPLSGKIEVRNLGYRYGEAEAPAFQNLNFTIEAGETVAIVGPSGCGKTTLLKCLMGLLQPSEGEILIDGLPLTNESMVNDHIKRFAITRVLVAHRPETVETAGKQIVLTGD